MPYQERPDDGGIPGWLRAWAARVGDESPLYAQLSAGIASDPVALEIIGAADPHQPQPHLLFAAVQYLLLSGADAALAAHFPAVSGGEPDPEDDAVARFRRFLADHRERLTELVATRRVQTNEVRRCTTLLPAFTAVREHDRPLALIEVGTSAGLNLLLDRYRYDYGTVRTGPEDSPLTIDCEVRSGTPPVPDRMPQVAWRLGLDLHPIDVHDPDAVRWGRALIWPEQLDRVERFETAVEIAQRNPPPLRAGDALSTLPEAIADAPEAASLIVFHSFVLNQWPAEARERLDDLLLAASKQHPIHRIAVEMLVRGEGYPAVIHTRYSGEDSTTRRLGTAHYHGVWLEWEG